MEQTQQSNIVDIINEVRFVAVELHENHATDGPIPVEARSWSIQTAGVSVEDRDVSQLLRLEIRRDLLVPGFLPRLDAAWEDLREHLDRMVYGPEGGPPQYVKGPLIGS